MLGAGLGSLVVHRWASTSARIVPTCGHSPRCGDAGRRLHQNPRTRRQYVLLVQVLERHGHQSATRHYIAAGAIQPPGHRRETGAIKASLRQQQRALLQPAAPTAQPTSIHHGLLRRRQPGYFFSSEASTPKLTTILFQAEAPQRHTSLGWRPAKSTRQRPHRCCRPSPVVLHRSHVQAHVVECSPPASGRHVCCGRQHRQKLRMTTTLEPQGTAARIEVTATGTRSLQE